MKLIDERTRTFTRCGLATIAIVAGLSAGLSLHLGCDGVLDLNGLAEVARLNGINVPPTMTPDSGPTSGGTRVTIRGKELRRDHVVKFGGQQASLNYVNEGLIEAITPARTQPGPVNVTIARANGTQQINVSGQFTYLDESVTIGAVSPSRGSTVGGQTVTIQGTNFKPDAAVLFGGFLGEQTQVLSDKVISTVAPAQAAGFVDIHIVTPGVPTVTFPAAFEYVTPAGIDSGEAPRVVGATSIDNNTVLVTFSKSMDRASVEDLTHYQITGTD